jgi:hypothetical protein
MKKITVYEYEESGIYLETFASTYPNRLAARLDGWVFLKRMSGGYYTGYKSLPPGERLWYFFLSNLGRIKPLRQWIFKTFRFASCAWK